jgi:hypothetical protein
MSLTTVRVAVKIRIGGGRMRVHARWRFGIRLGIAVAIAPLPLFAQAGRTTVIVGTGDATTGQFLRDVEVHITPLDRIQHTDSLGEARLRGIPSGRYTIETRRLGYAPLSAPILVRSEDSLEVVLLIVATATQLDTVTVFRSAIPMQLREFESRRERGFGQFVTEKQIDAAPGASLRTLLESHIRGVTVTGEYATGMHVTSLRQATEGLGRGPCQPMVFLNGVQLVDDTGHGPDISFIDLSSIAGIEYYSPSEIPVQYRTSGTLPRPGAAASQASATTPSCGAMLIWTRP